MTAEQAGSSEPGERPQEPRNLRELLAHTRRIAQQLEVGGFHETHRMSWRRLRERLAGHRLLEHDFPSVLKEYMRLEVGFQFALSDTQAYEAQKARSPK